MEPESAFSCYKEREDVTDDDNKNSPADDGNSGDGNNSNNGTSSSEDNNNADGNETMIGDKDGETINNINDAHDPSNTDNLILCRKGTFRRTVFFVAEGRGEVVLDCHDGQRGFPLGPGDGGGCSSTESLLGATAFSYRRTLRNRHKRCRHRDNKLRGSSCQGRKANIQVETSGRTSAACAAKRQARGDSSAGAGPAVVVGATAELEQKNLEVVASDEGATAVGRSAAESTLDASPGQGRVVEEQPSQGTSPPAAGLTVSFADEERQQDWWDSGDSGDERWPRLTVSAALLKRGDFFGVDPASPPPKHTEQVRLKSCGNKGR